MDRFIDFVYDTDTNVGINLKSNMDRFIGGQKRGGGSAVGNLKSNMDRFIDEKRC